MVIFLIKAVLAVLALTYTVSAETKMVLHQNFYAKPFDLFSEPKLSAPINGSFSTVRQRVDNFDPSNLDTWEQRYIMYNEFYQPRSPMFVYLSGNHEIDTNLLGTSHIRNIARDLNASIFYLEHRYYGQSHPTPNITNENMRFLNTEQVLADTAHFINHIRSTINGASNSHVIMVGRRYSASLCVWFRQRFPHLTIGVWASSATLPSVVDFDQFKVSTGRAFRTVGGDSCYDALESGFTTMANITASGQFSELTQPFRLCWDLEEKDIPYFFTVMADLYAVVPQTATEASIRGTCALLEREGNQLENLGAVLSFFLAPDDCLLIDYDYLTEEYRQTSWDSWAVLEGYRQWTYQLCSQIGWFRSSGSPNQPFGNLFPVDIYFTACQYVFGESFTPERIQRNSDRFNTMYGGLEPQVTNVVFVYGQYDPWSIIGRTTDLNDDVTAIVIAGATQGNEIAPVTPNDSRAVLEARNRISELISNWINVANGITTK